MLISGITVTLFCTLVLQDRYQTIPIFEKTRVSVLFFRSTAQPLSNHPDIRDNRDSFSFLDAAGSLSSDPEVKPEAAVDPLMVKGSVRNKTAFEVLKLVQVAKQSACKVRFYACRMIDLQIVLCSCCTCFAR